MSNEKKTIKVRDLKPNKDAKGGGHFPQGHNPQGHNPQGHNPQGHNPQGHKPQGGGQAVH